MPRIVSFLPAATEITYALGAGADLVGRSHECDYPPQVRSLPVVSKPVLPLDGLSQKEIDSAVAAEAIAQCHRIHRELCQPSMRGFGPRPGQQQRGERRRPRTTMNRARVQPSVGS